MKRKFLELLKPDVVYAIVGFITMGLSMGSVPSRLGLTTESISYLGAVVIALAGLLRIFLSKTDVDTKQRLIDATAIVVGAAVAAATALGFVVALGPDELAALGSSIGSGLAIIRSKLSDPPESQPPSATADLLAEPRA